MRTIGVPFRAHPATPDRGRARSRTRTHPRRARRGPGSLAAVLSLAVAMGLAAPVTAGAMLPSDAGGGAPAKKAKPKTVKRQKPVRVKRRQARAPRVSPQRIRTRRPRPVPRPEPRRASAPTPQPQPRPEPRRPQPRPEPPVRRRPYPIIERPGPREQREARRTRRREAAQLTVTRGRAYIAARDTLAENGGVLNGGLANALSHGRDPRVRRFVDRVDATLRDRRIARRRARERAAVRGRARTYANALDRLQEDDVMNMGLARALDLGDDPRVKRVAERMQRRDERAEQRERIRSRALRFLDGGNRGLREDPAVRRAIQRIGERRRRRDEGRRYAAVLDQIDQRGGALSMGTARALQELGDDPRVRRIARRIRTLRERRPLEEVFGPLDGPALLDPTLGLAIPWPGRGEEIGLSLEARCMRGLSPNAVVRCLTSPRRPRATVQLSSEVTGEISRGDPRLAFDGQEYETLGLSVGLRSTLGGSARRRRGIGLTLEAFTGRALTYELMLTSDRAEELADGDADTPNPLDPRSLERGETIVMGSEHYSGNGQEVSYRVLQASLGFEEGRRLSSGVERIGEDAVRIYVGDEDFVRQALELRLGTEDLGVAAGMSREFSEGDLRTIELNLNRRGGWNAYQRFVTTGTLPDSWQRGVRRNAEVDSASWSSSTSLELDAGPLHVGGSSTNNEGQVTETRYSNGRVRYGFTDRSGRVTYMEQATEDRDGHVRDSGYSLLLQDADPDILATFLELHGDRSDLGDDERSLRLDFTESELMALRRDAITRISELTQHSEDEALSPAEVEELIGDNGYNVVPGMLTSPSNGSYLRFLAASTTPSEVLGHLYDTSWGDPNRLLDDLWDLQAWSPHSDPPGDVTVFDD